MTDFPAAHSMDTDWYAVDRDGRVAQLWSAEEGAVPYAAHRRTWSELFVEILLARFELTPRSLVVVDVEPRAVGLAELPAQWDGVVRFASRDYLELFCSEHQLPARAVDELSLAVDGMYRAAFEDYWRAGAIVSAWVRAGVARPRVLGLYEYACGFSGPYRRAATPEEPLTIDHVPASLRDRIGALRFDRLAFERTESFDPAELVACHVYGS